MKLRYLVLGLALIGVAGLVFWQLRQPGPTSPARASVPSAVAQPPVAGQSSSEPLAPPAPTPPATVAASSPELAATARMYAAHAPLRTPEVADPDSESNRRILQAMVLKALERSSGAPPNPKPRS